MLSTERVLSQQELIVVQDDSQKSSNWFSGMFRQEFLFLKKQTQDSTSDNSYEVRLPFSGTVCSIS